MKRYVDKAITQSGCLALLAVCAMFMPRPASAEPICASCEFQMGLGGTYHFWSSTDGVVLPLTVAWSENRYELGVFHMSRQTLTETDTSPQPLIIDPYWGVSASRRWQLLNDGPVRAFFGFGLSYKTESDTLSATRWDFASQLGLRLRLPRYGSAVEFCIRHWSNGGIKQPNRGQDFATLTFLLDPRFFGAGGLNRTRGSVGP